MNRVRFLAILLPIMLVGCSNATTPRAEQSVTVTGIVTEVDDRVPVDGGVTITLELDKGGTERLLFESLFTDPPPDEDRLALYEKILTVEVGNHVSATGDREEQGIRLMDLVVLEP